MDDKERTKADAQLILEGDAAVVRRVVQIINEIFSSDKSAVTNCKWLINKLIVSENNGMQSEPLTDYIRYVVDRYVGDAITKQVSEYLNAVESRISHLQKLERQASMRGPRW